ncbi:MAG: indole-3-glycerol phosphate synthase TrpC [Planctomycetes bacterium]|nr:indole-3-glycerol phosphate synthase TrpC [Planctomycetota bacterium]
MSGFLERVLDEKRREIAEKKEKHPLSQLEFWASLQEIRDFRSALEGRGKIIAEIKKRSPSTASFKQNGKPERLARIYHTAGASAISVVTDERNFGTSLADVTEIRKAVPLPVLVKDFVIEPYQVIEARAAGADAILLIARILPFTDLADLLTLTRDLGFSALVECHSLEEIEKAVQAGAGIVGINARDLDSLRISLQTTEQLLSMIPVGTLRVAESGIKTPEDVKTLLSLGADAFLVGTALLNADDPGSLLRSLTEVRNEHGASHG